MTKEEFINQARLLQIYQLIDEKYKLEMENAVEEKRQEYLDELSLAEKDLIDSKQDFFQEVSSIEHEAIINIEAEKKRLRAGSKVLIQKEEELQAEKVLVELNNV